MMPAKRSISLWRNDQFPIQKIHQEATHAPRS